jgi:hypothetical protein
MTLKEKIEQRLKIINEQLNSPLLIIEYNVECMFIQEKKSLDWILEELEKQNCNNCNHKSECCKNTLYLITWDNDITSPKLTYCSNFEENLNEK